MVKRLFDVALAGAALLVSAPVLVIACVATRLASPGPILYRARRVGLGGREFTMFKLRTMHVATPGTGSVISAQHDPRVFRVGGWFRKAKIDELPQLINILRGDMSIVGPRPEDPRIVERHYTPAYRATLAVRPGLASPGSIFNYTHGEKMLSAAQPERDYVERLLPVKMAIENIYVQHGGLWYDIRIIARTAWVILASLLGRRDFPDPPELREVDFASDPSATAGIDRSAQLPDATTTEPPVMSTR